METRKPPQFPVTVYDEARISLSAFLEVQEMNAAESDLRDQEAFVSVGYFGVDDLLFRADINCAEDGSTIIINAAHREPGEDSFIWHTYHANPNGSVYEAPEGDDNLPGVELELREKQQLLSDIQASYVLAMGN